MVEEELVAFTIRIPASLNAQIEMRRMVNRRKKNAEITCLLEQAIDASVAADLKAARLGLKEA